MDNREYIAQPYNALRNHGKIHTQKDLAVLTGYSEGYVSRALKGDSRYTTNEFVSALKEIFNDEVSTSDPSLFPAEPETSTPGLPILPTSAIAGTLGDFADSVMTYDCERIVSPINGVDFAMKVCGESMSPEYPNGSTILIKRVNERAFIEWGKVYVLDTDNGAIVKQIRKTDDKSIVECISLNPEFQSFTIDTTFIKGWYRVLMVLSSK